MCYDICIPKYTCVHVPIYVWYSLTLLTPVAHAKIIRPCDAIVRTASGQRSSRTHVLSHKSCNCGSVVVQYGKVLRWYAKLMHTSVVLSDDK